MVTSCSSAVLVSEPWTTRVKLSTNLKPNLYASLQLFRKDLRGLNYINGFSKQHSIFSENKPLVKNMLLVLSTFPTFSFQRYFFFWGYSISFPLILVFLLLLLFFFFFCARNTPNTYKNTSCCFKYYEKFLNPKDGRQPSLSSSFRSSVWQRKKPVFGNCFAISLADPAPANILDLRPVAPAFVHHKARATPYPQCAAKRFPVADENVPWEVSEYMSEESCRY